MQSKKKLSNAPSKSEPQGHRIAFYIRVSTEEQAENPEGSIRSQEERLRETVKFKNLSGNFGSIADVFIDRAKSGKNTQRPELQRMLRAIEKGEINLVMVSELSRLSRSIKDFSEMWELMQSCGCGFLSLRESFDTTTAAGEMVLYSIANIAQFERRQISERVSANMQSRASRGLYNGGMIPVGYRVDTEKRGHLLVDTEHAEVVRHAFDAFIRERSLAPTAKWLNANGHRIQHRRSQGGGKTARLGHFTTTNLQSLLRNKAVIGVKQYNVRGEIREVKAAWEPIVVATVFDRVQEMLDKNRSHYKPDSFKQHAYELSGLVYCGQCGGTLCGKSANGNGGKIPYYEHAWLTKRNGCLLKKAYDCRPFRVPARELEPKVWEDVETMLKDETRGRLLIESAHRLIAAQSQTTEIERAQNRVQDVQRQLDTLTERLSLLPSSIDPQPIFRQMERLQTIKREEDDHLLTLKQNAVSDLVPAELSSYQEMVKNLRYLAEKDWGAPLRTRIIQALVHHVEITEKGFRIHFKWTENEILRGLEDSSQMIRENAQQEGVGQSMKFKGDLSVRENSQLSKSGTTYFGSRTLTIGWGTRIRT